MDLSGDPYELLGVKKDASQDDIQKALQRSTRRYRRYQPDEGELGFDVLGRR
jgi:curved DNA-binding protein CbpA